MADSIIVYLEKIEDEELHIFYNSNSYLFEVKQAENIQFMEDIIKKFPTRKSFIEDTKEEFSESGRSSDDLSASLLKIKHEKYSDIVKEIELHVIEISRRFEAQFEKKRRSACANLSELCELFNFFTRYEDLIDESEYACYAYYVIDEKHEA